MAIVRIEHTVASYEAWKKSFDSDPVDRAASGVRRYVVLRSVEKPNRVLIDLELDTVTAATAMVTKLNAMWAGPAKAVVTDPRVEIVESVEAREVRPKDRPTAPAH